MYIHLLNKLYRLIHMNIVKKKIYSFYIKIINTMAIVIVHVTEIMILCIIKLTSKFSVDLLCSASGIEKSKTVIILTIYLKKKTLFRHVYVREQVINTAKCLIYECILITIKRNNQMFIMLITYGAKVLYSCTFVEVYSLRNNIRLMV